MGKIIPKKEISFKPAFKAAYLSNQNIHFWNFLKRKTHPQNKIQFPGPPLTLSKKGNPQIDGNGLPKKEIRKRCIKNHSHWLSVTFDPLPHLALPIPTKLPMHLLSEISDASFP
jgi:hypothetical protein